MVMMKLQQSLECRDLSCERDGAALFRPVSFRLESGSVVQVSGPNGAGKTTFLRALCGLFSDWSGQLLWNDKPYRHPAYDMREAMLYLGHQPGVKKTLTARENLTWIFGVHGLAFPGSVEAALEKVGLAGYEDVACHQMSAGQMRRVALARLYVSAAPLWILDEPFTAIDKDGVLALEARILEHAQVGGMIVLTTHQPLGVPQVRVVKLSAAIEVEA